MSDLIRRQDAVNALDKRFDDVPLELTTEILLLRKDLREVIQSAQPETISDTADYLKLQNSNDTISRQAAIDALCAECTVDNPKTCSTIQEGDRWCDEVYILLNLPSAQPEKRTEERTETHACDLIDRQEAIDEINKLEYPSSLVDVKRIIMELPSAQPDLDEWCTDCSEYDQERHCCPRFNKVIREALKEVKKDDWVSCSERLPERDGEYLVTYEKGYAEDYGFDLVGIAPFEVDCEGFGIWQENFDLHTLGSLGSDWVDIPVIAWMPLPEPWKRREE